MQSDPTPQPDTETLSRLESLATEMAVKAGRILTGHFGKSIDVEFKSDDKTNPVSQADKESEEYLKSTISSKFPDHRVLGEEGTDTGAPDADFLWVLDPLDGTVNFLNGFPIYAVSIGVLYKGHPVVGSIWTPFSGRAEGSLYHARLGGGAFRDGERIRVRNNPAPQPGQLMIMPLMFRRRFHQKAGPETPLGEGRNLGSIAYEMAVTASGMLQYSLFSWPGIWDVAGGMALINEAGGANLTYDWRRSIWRFSEPFPTDSPTDPKDPKHPRNWRKPVLVGDAELVGYLSRLLVPGWFTRLKRRLKG